MADGNTFGATAGAGAVFPAGSIETQRFYDQTGWRRTNGVLEDRALFGARRVGPIQRTAHARRMARVLASLREAGSPLSLLECGCGGNPERALLPLCSHYTGIDFSVTGIEAARNALSAQDVPFTLVNGDICRLPFADATFDAVYSANAIYHIPDPEAQAAAYREAVRVVRPGGVALFVMANPHPLAFPIRLTKRLVAETPVVSGVLDALRPAPLLPYRPMPRGWTERILRPLGGTSIRGHAMASTWFAQHVSERGVLGATGWKLMAWLEDHHPLLAGYLGNYVLIVVHKTET
jgi:ubiquinone/menaquinone biosynthesis C-methylase UbiE